MSLKAFTLIPQQFCEVGDTVILEMRILRFRDQAILLKSTVTVAELVFEPKLYALKPHILSVTPFCFLFFVFLTKSTQLVLFVNL